ncbi:MAG: ATP-grasp domain-containing protein [Verrucomicrobiia bacterium]
MNVLEYQAREIFRRFGAPVPDGGVAFTPEEAEEVVQAVRRSGVPAATGSRG